MSFVCAYQMFIVGSASLNTAFSSLERLAWYAAAAAASSAVRSSGGYESIGPPQHGCHRSGFF